MDTPSEIIRQRKTQEDLHVHKAQTRLLMIYVRPNGEKVARVMRPGYRDHEEEMIRILRWCSHHGVEIIFRPV